MSLTINTKYALMVHFTCEVFSVWWGAANVTAPVPHINKLYLPLLTHIGHLHWQIHTDVSHSGRQIYWSHRVDLKILAAKCDHLAAAWSPVLYCWTEGRQDLTVSNYHMLRYKFPLKDSMNQEKVVCVLILVYMQCKNRLCDILCCQSLWYCHSQLLLSF